MIQIQSFPFNPFSENTYVVFNENKNAFIIDPGNFSEEETKVLENFIAENDLKVQNILLTHAHIDHIKGLKSVYKEFKPTVFTRNEEVIEKNICDSTYFDKPYILDDLEVSYFNLSHDSDCIGIKIKENRWKKKTKVGAV